MIYAGNRIELRSSLELPTGNKNQALHSHFTLSHVIGIHNDNHNDNHDNHNVEQ